MLFRSADGRRLKPREVVAEFAKQARLPGFRPGKAPAAMIARRFAKEIAEEFKQKVVGKAYREGLEKEKIDVLNVVNLEEGTIAVGTAATVTITLDVRPEFVLPDYTQLPTEITATDATEQRSASASFNRRIVQCVIMFLLPFLALPMAVPPKRSTSALGVFLSIIALVTFHKFTEYGERMGTLGRIDPVLAQWVPFALFLGVALWLFRVLERPGGQPIGALDRWFGKITGFLSGLAGKLVRRQNWADDVLSAG